MFKNIKLTNSINAIKFAFSNAIKFSKMYILLTAISQLINAFLPFINIFGVRFIIEELTTTKDYEKAVIYVVIMFILNLILKELAIFLTWGESINFMSLMDKFFIRNSKKLMNLDYECLENQDSLNKINNMYITEMVCANVVNETFSLLASMLGLIGSIAIIATLDPIFILLLFIFVVAISFVNGKVIKKVNKVEMSSAPVRRRGDYLSQITLNSHIGKEIRVFLAQSFFLNKISDNIKDAFSFEKKKSSILLKASLFSVIVNVLQVGALYAYMSWKFILGAISISQFSMYLGTATNFASCILKISNSFVTIASKNEIINKYNEYHDLPESLRESSKKDAKLPSGTFKLEFRNVFFKYPNAKDYTLKDISFKMQEGETISIIGKNGAGKTTLVKLICRLYDPTQGTILLNGTNIKDYNYDEYMKFIGTVFQDFKLFSFSIRDNLDITCEKSEEYILKALENSNVLEKIKSLPDGLDSHLYKGHGWDAVELSGGEYQKLAIARAYIKDANMVILDEPTAAVDPISEYNIYKSFNKLVENKNSVYISHRLSSAKFSDKIIFIDNKTITEEGTHDELMGIDGDYAKMYSVQAMYYK